MTRMDEPQQSPLTVITFGTYDLFHLGHLRIIERTYEVGVKAAKEGQKVRLVVGISSDALNRSKKGCNTIVGQEERLAIVKALGCVDEAFYEESLDLKCEYVRQFGANILVMGDDHTGRFGEVENEGCSRVFLERTAGVSTSERLMFIACDESLKQASEKRKAHEAATYANDPTCGAAADTGAPPAPPAAEAVQEEADTPASEEAAEPPPAPTAMPAVVTPSRDATNSASNGGNIFDIFDIKRTGSPTGSPTGGSPTGQSSISPSGDIKGMLTNVERPSYVTYSRAEGADLLREYALKVQGGKMVIIDRVA